MFWFWGPHWGWLPGLINGLFWLVVIVIAVLLLRQELPNLGSGGRYPPALRVLEERYARGEISREEFLQRRAVLLAPGAAPAEPGPPPPPAPPSPASPEPSPPPEAAGSEPTIPLPPGPDPSAGAPGPDRP